jgi:choloylglycine hydrolase
MHNHHILQYLGVDVMKLKRLVTIFLTLVLIVCLSSPAMACTIFSTELEDGTILVGNNEDYMYSINNNMVVTAPSKDSYGRICFYNMSYVQGGMNEYGLFYDGASCPPSEVPYDSNKELLDYNLGDIVLSKCTTVEEVEKFFDNYNIPDSFCDHLLFTDPTGASAVFEWMKGELHIIRKGQDENYQVVTNYWLTDPTLGGYPCDRYNTAVDLLQKQSPSIELCANILDATKQNWGDGGTLYSNIYNLSSKEVYVFSRGAMNLACKIDMEEQFQSMEAGTQVSYDLSELTYDTQITTSNLNKENIQATVSIPTPEAEGNIETAAISSTQDNAQSNNGFYWIFGIGILSLITFAIVMAVKRKNRS